MFQAYLTNLIACSYEETNTRQKKIYLGYIR